MVPIYESDVADERWSKSEWNHYELWEKVEQRIRRHNRLWIVATALVFLGLSSVPIIMDRSPKWTTLAGLRNLGQEVNDLKREAGLRNKAYRIRFSGEGSLSYVVERTEHCTDAPSRATVEKRGSLVPEGKLAKYVLLTRARGESLKVPGLLEEFCYDPLNGSAPFVAGESVSGFGVIPAADLASGRMDRMSVLVVSGASGEVAFE
jgi:hypothetical protein